MTTETDTPQSRELRRLASGQDWYGYLTRANLDAVAERLRQLLCGGRPMVSVYSNEDFWVYRPPEVRSRSTLTVKVTQPRSGAGGPYITIEHGGWISWLGSEVADQAMARALRDQDRPPYLHFLQDRVEITDHAPAGNKFFHVFAVQESDL